jgi:transposase-like protein
VHFDIRLEEGRQCILALMGATAEGKKELIPPADGYREGEQSWEEPLLDCEARGPEVEPALAVGDGARGLWEARRQVWGTTQGRRCRLHKTAHVLDERPRGAQPKAGWMPHDIYEAGGPAKAGQAFGPFVRTFEAKSPKATECLSKARGPWLTLYDFPAGH